MSKSLSLDNSKKILGQCSKKLRDQGVNLKVFFVVCGSRGDEENVMLVKEEEQETALKNLDNIFYSHIYSVQSSDLKLEELAKEKTDLPSGVRESSQSLISKYLTKSNPPFFDKSLGASSSSKPSNTKLKPAKQCSMQRFVYKKQNPPANPGWINRLRLEFEELESTQPLETEEMIDEITKDWRSDDFETVDSADTDISEPLEDIVCNWSFADFDNDELFEDNNEVSVSYASVANSETDGTVLGVIADIIDEVLDIVSKGQGDDKVKHLQTEDTDKANNFKDMVCHSTVPGYEVKIGFTRVSNSETDGTVVDVIADIIDEVLDFVSKGQIDGKVKHLHTEDTFMMDNFEDMVCNWTPADFENVDNGDNIEVKIDSSRVVKSEPEGTVFDDTSDGEFLEDIFNDWDIDDFKESESYNLENKSRKRKLCESEFFEDDRGLERKKSKEVQEYIEDKTPEEKMKRLLDDVLDHIDYGEASEANADILSRDGTLFDKQMV